MYVKYVYSDDHPPWITDVNYYSTPSVREGGCRRCPYVGDSGHDNARVISEQRGRYVKLNIFYSCLCSCFSCCSYRVAGVGNEAGRC